MLRFVPVLFVVVCAVHARPSADGAEPRAGGRFVCEWGTHGSADGEFDVPIGIAVTADGDLFVSDFYNARVQRFSVDGQHRATFGVLPNPGPLALDREGHLFISHFSAMKKDEEKKPDRISVYTPQGELLRQWGQTGTGDGEFDYPGGIAISREDRVYVADQTNRRVQVFDRGGKFLFKWGEYGTGPGQFGGNVSIKSRVGGPQFVAVAADGHVFTTEGSVGRVQEFTAEGQFVRAWGDNADRAGGFGGFWRGTSGLQGPVGLCFDPGGKLWITSVGGRVQQFTVDGTYVQGLGSGRGTDPGQFEAPHAVATDRRGHVYVVDSLNHRVQKFAAAD